MRTNRLAVAVVTSLMLTVAGAGCADSDDSTNTADEQVTASASTSAAPTERETTKSKNTSAGETKKDLLKRVAADPDYKDSVKDFPADVQNKLLDCMVDVLVKYGAPTDIQKYIDGKIKKAENIKGTESKAATDAGFACVDKVT
jgi:hypothetical protein